MLKQFFDRHCLYLIVTIMLTSLLSSAYAQFGSSKTFGGNTAFEKNGAKTTISLVSQYSEVARNNPFYLIAEIEIIKGWHLYGNILGEKSGGLGLPTKLVLPQLPHVHFANILYPQAKVHEDKALDVVYNIYEDKLQIPIEIMISADAPIGMMAIAVGYSGLVCSDNGTCLPWNIGEDTVTVNINVTASTTVATKPLSRFAHLPLLNKADQVVGKGDIESNHDIAIDATLPADGTYVIEVPPYEPVGIPQHHWFKWLCIALAAGAILNLMPCVLPVIPLKVLAMIQQGQAAKASGDKYKALKLSLVFSLGIIVVFGLLALMMSIFQMYYGQQFQGAAFKLILMLIIFVFGLSMLGFFEVALPGKVSNIEVKQKGYLGTFFTGVLATLLATPCGGPLLGPVLTWSLLQSTSITVMVFLVIGLGMALPYVLLTAFPALMDKMPKAGNWMIRFKQVMGAVMLAVALYIGSLFGPEWFWTLVLFCILTTFCLWLAFRIVNYDTPETKKLLYRVVAVGIFIGVGGLLWLNQPVNGVVDDSEGFLDALKAYHHRGETVVVDFTANWCPNCKYVEATVLHTDAFTDAMKAKGFDLLVADWSQRGPVIKAVLEQLQSRSIPLTAIFRGDDPLHPIVIPDIYTLDTMLEKLAKIPANNDKQ
jgi:thiol:disulfide interchange protein